MRKDLQYKICSIVYKLYDGKNYVKESEIRSIWEKCPSLEVILNLTANNYLQESPELNHPGYIPTPLCLRTVKDHRRNTLTLWIGIFTLITTMVSLVIGFL